MNENDGIVCKTAVASLVLLKITKDIYTNFVNTTNERKLNYL